MLCLMLDMSDFPAIFATNDRWLTTKLYDNERVVLWMTSLVFRSKRGHLRMTFDFEKQHSTQHSYCKNTQQSTWRGTFKLNHICRSVTTVVGFFVVLWESFAFGVYSSGNETETTPSGTVSAMNTEGEDRHRQDAVNVALLSGYPSITR